MKTKKMLAILAVLSVLGITGCGNDGTEESIAIIEPVTEIVTTTATEAETAAMETTTETEAETTAAETTVETTVETAVKTIVKTEVRTVVETMVTEKTVVIEENQAEPEKGTFEAGNKDYQMEQNGMVHSVTVACQLDYETFSRGVTTTERLVVYVDGAQAGNFYMGGATLHDDFWKDKFSDVNVDNYFSINGDIMNIKINNKTTAYRYDETSKTLIEADNITTTTEENSSQPVTGDFELDGVTLTPKVEYSDKEPGLDKAWLYLKIYSQDGTLLLSVPADTYNADYSRPENYGKVDRYLVVTGSNTITVIDYSDLDVKKYHSYVFENGEFVS